MALESMTDIEQKPSVRVKKRFLRICKVEVRYSLLEMKEIQKRAGAWHTSMAAYIRNASLNYRKGAK